MFEINDFGIEMHTQENDNSVMFRYTEDEIVFVVRFCDKELVPKEFKDIDVFDLLDWDKKHSKVNGIIVDLEDTEHDI